MKKTSTCYFFDGIGNDLVIRRNGEHIYGAVWTREEARPVLKEFGLDPDAEVLRLRLVHRGVWREVGRRLKRGSCFLLLPDQVEKMRSETFFQRKTRKGDVVKSGAFLYVLWQDKRGRWYAA